MRKSFSQQQRLDCPSIGEVELNLECRHELIPILKALQHVYSRPEIRDRILDLIAQDINQDSRTDCGREGFDYWQVLVLAAVRLGCNLDYDQLQDLAEQHRKLRQIMGVGEWDERTSFHWQRIRDNVCLLRPSTIDAICQAIVAEGHRLDPDAAPEARISGESPISRQALARRRAKHRGLENCDGLKFILLYPFYSSMSSA